MGSVLGLPPVTQKRMFKHNRAILIKTTQKGSYTNKL